MQKHTPAQIRFLAIRTVGNFLVLSSLFGMFLTFGPAVKNELVYRYQRIKGVRYVVRNPEVSNILPLPEVTPIPNQGFFRDLIGQQNEVQTLVPVDPEFSVVIPKIAANAKIIPNVDASNHDQYLEALKEGVAHAWGTYFPGEGGNIYLFAHSTDNFWNIGRYNAVFYLLKELEEKDEIDIFYRGRRYIYIVSEKKIVDPLEVEYLNRPTGFEQLTLQTCWPPGTTFKRLIIIAKPISNTNISSQ